MCMVAVATFKLTALSQVFLGKKGAFNHACRMHVRAHLHLLATVELLRCSDPNLTVK